MELKNRIINRDTVVKLYLYSELEALYQHVELIKKLQELENEIEVHEKTKGTVSKYSLQYVYNYIERSKYTSEYLGRTD